MCNILNIISSPEHPIVLLLSWFELHNPKIDWRKREIKYYQQNNMKPQAFTHRISTISLHPLRKEGRKEEMFFICSISETFPNVVEEK